MNKLLIIASAMVILAISMQSTDANSILFKDGHEHDDEHHHDHFHEHNHNVDDSDEGESEEKEMEKRYSDHHKEHKHGHGHQHDHEQNKRNTIEKPVDKNTHKEKAHNCMRQCSKTCHEYKYHKKNTTSIKAI